MILHRTGSKKRLVADILPLIPKHEVYVELFFGAGSLYFSKQKVKYNFLNDLDLELYNFWQVIKDENKLSLLCDLYESTPLHQIVLEDCKNKSPTNEIEMAAQFLILSNHTFLGKGNTLRNGLVNSKDVFLQNVKATHKQIIKGCNFLCKDFKDVLASINIRGENEVKKVFVYADPPYTGKTQPYNTPKWKETDFADLVKTLVDSGYKFAISEYNSEFVLDTCKGLYIHTLGEIQTMKNRNTEILITNFETSNKLF